MAKAATVKIKLVSSADTGFFYVTKKNSRTKTDKLVDEEIRPGGAQARRVPRVQDQVGGSPLAETKKAPPRAVLFHSSLKIVAGPERVCTRRPLNPF